LDIPTALAEAVACTPPYTTNKFYFRSAISLRSPSPVHHHTPPNKFYLNSTLIALAATTQLFLLMRFSSAAAARQLGSGDAI
jgi:hypothetical protein